MSVQQLETRTTAPRTAEQHVPQQRSAGHDVRTATTAPRPPAWCSEEERVLAVRMVLMMLGLALCAGLFVFLSYRVF